MDFTEIQKDMVKWRRYLHQNPELGLELPKTVKYVSSVLDEIGVDYEVILGGSAIVGLIKGEETGEGRCIGLRADMDALPVKEETGLEFAATNGKMHACGHDTHTAMLLGAAKYLASHRNEFKGTVKLFFQPGEEGPGGAKPMIEAGCLENPKVDIAFGIHAGTVSKEVPLGGIGVKKGPLLSASDMLRCTIKGKGSHASMPELGIDPVTTAAEIIMGLQAFNSRERKSTIPAVLSICEINAGTANNIIPNELTFSGNIRTTTNETRALYKKRICEIIEYTAKAHLCEAIIEYKEGYPPLVCDDDVAQLAYDAGLEEFGNDKCVMIKEVVMASEDFSYFANALPSAFGVLYNTREVDGQRFANHHPKFDIMEDTFEIGAKWFVSTVKKYLV